MNRERSLGSKSGPVDRRVVLLAATLSQFVVGFMSSALNVATPTIGWEFGLDAVAMSWVITGFVLAAAMFLVPFGRLADMLGCRRVFLTGAIVFTCATVICAFAPSANILILFRAVQGIGSSMIFGTAMALLTNVYPVNERGAAIGLFSASAYIGLSCGPFLGGMITSALGWRSLFFVVAPLGLFLVLLTWFKVRQDWVSAKGERFDWVGSLLYSIPLIMIMYGITLLPEWHGLVLASAGIVGLVVFIIWENRVETPVLKLSLFRHNLVFGISCLAAFISYSAVWAVGFVVSMYLQYIKGMDPWSAGVVMIAQPVTQAIFSPLAGRLSDRLEPRIVASVGMAFTCAGLGLLAFLTAATDIWYIVAALMVAGLGFALFAVPNTHAIMSSVPKNSYGIASAIISTMRTTGQMASMGVVTVLLALMVGVVQITPEYYANFVLAVKAIFAVFAVLCLIATVTSFARGKVHNEEDGIGPILPEVP